MNKKKDFDEALAKADAQFRGMRNGLIRPRVVIEPRDNGGNHFSISIKDEARFKFSEPEFVGAFPIRQDIEVIPTNPNSIKIGFPIEIYAGCEVFGDAEHTIRLTKYEDIYPGREVYLSWNENDKTPLTVDKDKNLSSGHVVYSLEFDEDDRHCWVNSMVMNMRGLKKLEFFND